ncbi:hypothetical protein O9993_00045 [Vibrio lentus]|nr:hypothetical protein [Vibrio lentus]
MAGMIATLFWAFDISEMKRLNEQLEEEKQQRNRSRKPSEV